MPILSQPFFRFNAIFIKIQMALFVGSNESCIAQKWGARIEGVNTTSGCHKLTNAFAFGIVVKHIQGLFYVLSDVPSRIESSLPR